MFDFCGKAMDIISSKGVSFGDIRIIDERSQHLAVKKGSIAKADDAQSLGFGIRVLYKGAWGFASSNELSMREIERVALLAVETAKASSTVKGMSVRLAPEPVYLDRWQSPYLIDPFSVPMRDKMDILMRTDELLRKNKKVTSSMAMMYFVRKHQYHATTEGSRIEQVLTYSGATSQAVASDGHESQMRSYPYGRHMLQMGYEAVDSLDLPAHAERIREEAVALLSAPVCPSGEKDLIISGEQLGLQIHESVGHASELDRVLGYEESYAGSSFATTEKLGRFRYGSPIVNLVADATLPGGLATAGYDDDGVRAQRWHIVKNGVLSGYMTNREFCGAIKMNRSWGCNRADSFASIPITRICNLGLMAGDWEYDDMVADTKDGIIMENNRSWSIDQKRLNFQFGSEIGWLVKNGKIKGMVKNPSYQGITPEFWNSCDAICNHKHWKLYGVVNCGKGQPMQVARMCHASSPARFRNVKIGIKS
jgi:TldD protein